MSKKQEQREPTQKTQPKRGKPIEIPVPKRGDFERVLRRATGSGDAGGHRSVEGKHKER